MSNNLLNLKLHCIGIGGEGVGTLGMLMAHLGIYVTGSDSQLSHAQKETLTKAKIKKIYENHAYQNVNDATAVLFGSAIPFDNCELQEAIRSRKALITRAKLLGFISKSFENSTAVVGTHGKSSTTMFFTQLTKELLGISAHSLLGGQCIEYEFLSYTPGKNTGNKWLIAEVTETDRDFGEFQADLILCPALSWDHFDQYPTPESYINEFMSFFESQSKNTIIVSYTDNREIISKLKSLTCKAKAICIGEFNDCDYRIDNITPYSFKLYKNTPSKKILITTSTRNSLPGYHYSKNIAVALVGIIERYQGTPITPRHSFKPWVLNRRFDTITIASRSIILDNAHHWEAIEENLRTIRLLYPNQKIAAIYRPSHNFHPQHFANALKGFDYIYLTKSLENSASTSWCHQIKQALKKINKDSLVFSDDLILDHITKIEASTIILVAGARAQPPLRQLLNRGDPAG